MSALEEREPVRRLRAADVIATYERTLEAITTRKTTGDVSVDYTRNAKGETQIVVKIAAPMGCDLDELRAFAEEVRKIATATYDAAAARFPAASGYVTNDGKTK